MVPELLGQFGVKAVTAAQAINATPTPADGATRDTRFLHADYLRKTVVRYRDEGSSRAAAGHVFQAADAVVDRGVGGEESGGAFAGAERVGDHQV